MMDRIRDYFKRLGMSEEEAEELHLHYYREYGLAIRGLIKHHTIDPLDYDAQCDASLPLENILRPDERLVSMLESLDRSRCRVYALTNAYKTHATRVLKLVGLSHVIDAVVYCDYSNPELCVESLLTVRANPSVSSSSPQPKQLGRRMRRTTLWMTASRMSLLRKSWAGAACISMKARMESRGSTLQRVSRPSRACLTSTRCGTNCFFSKYNE